MYLKGHHFDFGNRGKETYESVSKTGHGLKTFQKMSNHDEFKNDMRAHHFNLGYEANGSRPISMPLTTPHDGMRVANG